MEWKPPPLLRAQRRATEVAYSAGSLQHSSCHYFTGDQKPEFSQWFNLVRIWYDPMNAQREIRIFGDVFLGKGKTRKW
jgi:hypothetical protein